MLTVRCSSMHIITASNNDAMHVAQREQNDRLENVLFELNLLLSKLLIIKPACLSSFRVVCVLATVWESI